MQHAQLLAMLATCLHCSVLDVETFIIATTDVTAVRRDEWEGVERATLSERIDRRIDGFGNTRCYHNTSFAKDELKQLLVLFLVG